MTHHPAPKVFSSRLHDYTVYYYTKDEFHYLKGEIFTQDSYYFETENPQPVIIDASAHIGLATLYFKKLYPNAQITAIEPNPLSFALLEKNVFENQLDDVRTINAALAENHGTAELFRDKTEHQWWSTASFLEGAWTGDQKSENIRVPTLPLTDLVTGPVDFLKIDIEGAEQRVLTAAEEVLPMINHIFIEFHPHSGQDQYKLVEMLEKYFKISYYQKGRKIRLNKVRGLFQIEGKR